MHAPHPNLTAVDHLLRHCGGLTANESLAIVCDPETRDVANIFAQQAHPLSRHVGLYEAPVLKIHGEEPPAAIANAMREADLILGMTRMSMAHTRARQAASHRGARYLSMPDYDLPLLHNPAVVTDYHAASPRVRRFADAFDSGSVIRVTTGLGTDIELDIGARQANFCPGYVEEPGSLGSPPDIEANISPIETASNGVIIVDGSIPCPEIGLLQAPVRLEIGGGKIRQITTEDEKLLHTLLALFGRVGSAKAYVLGECGIGLNPAAQLTGNMLTDEGAFGCVHFGFGSNATVGGANDVPFHLDLVLRDPTLRVDGQILIDKGDVLL